MCFWEASYQAISRKKISFALEKKSEMHPYEENFIIKTN